MLFVSLVCCCLALVGSSHASAAPADDAELLYTALVRRHGPRTPYRNTQAALALRKWNWVEGAGQLSADGIAQDTAAGAEIRKRWAEKLQLQPSDMRIFSSDNDVTLRSSQALMRGLFGAEDRLQKVPVHASAVFNKYMACPTADRLKQRATSDARWQEKLKDASVVTTLNALRRFFPASQVTLASLPQLAQPLECAALSSFNFSDVLPEGMPPALMWDALRLSDWALSRPYMWRGARQLAVLTGGPLLQQIVGAMGVRAFAAPGGLVEAPKMGIFSAHRDNILGLLGVFKMHTALDKKPAVFGTVLELSLYRSQKLGGLFVTVSYKGQLVDIPNCESPCKFDFFKRVFSSTIEMDEGQWEAHCETSVPYCDGVPLGNPNALPVISLLPLWTVGGILIGLLVFGISGLVAFRWWRNRKRRTRQQVLMQMEL